MKKNFTVCIALGTRPEAIKLAPVIMALRALPGLTVRVLVTGQHRVMMDEALSVFDIRPDYDLDIMRKGQALFDVTARILQGVPRILSKEPVDLMIVQGDTATTFACSLAAYYHRIPVAHVEAGLRTGDKYRPFPEEINRRLTGVLADIHFPPTPQAEQALLREGVSRQRVLMTGNTVVDALKMAGTGKGTFTHPVLKTLDEHRRKIVLATLHRRESFGDGLRRVLSALRDISMLPGVDVVYPVHLNPQVRAQVRETLAGGKVHLLEPLAYNQFILLMKKARVIVTDSGGIQEEACALKKPVLITRETTERPEAVASGFAELLGFDRRRITAAAERLLMDDKYYRERTRHENPFGDGKASVRIAKACLSYLKEQQSRGKI
ncbi:MAG: UDP-N-acetylglucosamine 2-epimerase (non-hydrolyzing) [Candidatus Omnitrophota bacterium]